MASSGVDLTASNGYAGSTLIADSVVGTAFIGGVVLTPDSCGIEITLVRRALVGIATVIVSDGYNGLHKHISKQAAGPAGSLALPPIVRPVAVGFHPGWRLWRSIGAQ